jgi:hypothetical protein
MKTLALGLAALCASTALPTAAVAGPLDDGAQTHLSAAWLPAGVGLAARAVGEKDAWLGVEGRFAPDGRWLARGSLGFDVFGGSPIDLRLGLFAAGLGTVEDFGSRQVGMSGPAFGTDLALGGSFNRLYGHIRWLTGFEASGDAGWLNETEYLVGFRVAGEVRVFGEYLSVRDDVCCRRDGFGVGLDVAF